MSAASDEDDAASLPVRLAHSLHEICQPLTALQCRLEMAQLEREGKEPDGTDRTLAECLRECERMSERVNTMRTLVRSALASQAERNAQPERI